MNTMVMQNTCLIVALRSTDVGMDTWLCCTLVVATEGKFKLPKINSSADLKKALTLLGSASPDTLLAFELLWTPQVGVARICSEG